MLKKKKIPVFWKLVKLTLLQYSENGENFFLKVCLTYDVSIAIQAKAYNKLLSEVSQRWKDLYGYFFLFLWLFGQTHMGNSCRKSNMPFIPGKMWKSWLHHNCLMIHVKSIIMLIQSLFYKYNYNLNFLEISMSGVTRPK